MEGNASQSDVGLDHIAKISYASFFHGSITILILSQFFSFSYLSKTILQVTTNSGPQFCFQTYGGLTFGSSFLKLISF